MAKELAQSKSASLYQALDALFTTSTKLPVRWDSHAAFYAMSKALHSSADPFKNSVLFINEKGIWPSSENTFLLKCVLDVILGHNAVEPVFCISFDDTEQAQSVTMLQLALQFGWGGIFSSNNDTVFVFNHDGFGTFSSSQALVNPFLGLTGVHWEEADVQ